MPTSRNEQRRRRLARLHQANPNCYWCDTETVLILGGPSDHTIPHRATTDHLRHRFDANRSEPAHAGEERTVLSCWRCNQWRGRKREGEYVAQRRFHMQQSSEAGASHDSERT